jgi:hypothetical protein
MITRTLSDRRSSTFQAQAEKLAKDLRKKGDASDTDCISRALELNDLANQDFAIKMQSLGLAVSLGFVFEVCTNSAPSIHVENKLVRTQYFHVGNYMVARCMELKTDALLLKVDGFSGEAKPILDTGVTKLLLASPNPELSIIYTQENLGQKENTTVASECLRPTPFKLDKYSHREVYMGESIGLEATQHMCDITHHGEVLDRTKIPVLLAD